MLQQQLQDKPRRVDVSVFDISAHKSRPVVGARVMYWDGWKCMMAITHFQNFLSTCSCNWHTLGYYMLTQWADKALLSRVDKEGQYDFSAESAKLRKHSQTA